MSPIRLLGVDKDAVEAEHEAMRKVRLGGEEPVGGARDPPGLGVEMCRRVEAPDLHPVRPALQFHTCPDSEVSAAIAERTT